MRPVSTWRISTNVGSNARTYGKRRANLYCVSYGKIVPDPERTKAGRRTLPVNHEILSGPPSILVHIECKFWGKTNYCPAFCSMEDIRHTVITQEKLVFYSVDSHRAEIFPFPYEIQRSVCRIKKSLRIETLKVNNLKPFRAPYAEFRLQEMDRTRLYRDIEFL